MSIITTVPLSQLKTSPKNVRTNPGDVSALVSSIATQGLLQNLVVSADGSGGYYVDAGGRRLAALQSLASQGALAPDAPIPVRIVEDAQRTAVSLSENVQREAMHPADEFEAFKKLTDEGFSIDRIADAFGVTPLVVERRLKLSAAAPELIDRFRAGDLTTEQMIALCATDDHDRQVSVWSDAASNPWMAKPSVLRRAALREGEIDAASDTRVQFIGGIGVYQEAGGEVRRDLFHGDGKSGGFITDEVLLESLVAAKLEEHAQEVRAEGWGWVEVWTKFDWSEAHRMGSAPEAPAELSEKAQKELAILRERCKALEAELARLEESEESCPNEIAELTAELEDVDDDIYETENPEQEVRYLPEVMAHAGAIVAFDRGAQPKIMRGKVRVEDRQRVAVAAGEVVVGGRETKSPGRKSDALSGTLTNSLLGYRNLAVQTVVASKPDLAKVLLACWAVQTIREQRASAYEFSSVPTDLGIEDGWRGTRNKSIADEDGQALVGAFHERCVGAVASLPTDEDGLWEALVAMTPAALDALIAHAVALSVSVSKDHDGLTAKLLGAAGFEMSEHFTPTASNYLGRVSKALIIEALEEAEQVSGAEDKAALLAMKKGDLAVEAESRLAGTGWVPASIRTPLPGQATPRAD